MNQSTGKKMSPLRALQYSSALDTHNYMNPSNPDTELIHLSKCLREKNKEIDTLKRNYFEAIKAESSKKDLQKSITNSYKYNIFIKESFPVRNNSPIFVQKATIVLPNNRNDGFNPITGTNKDYLRSYSPFQDIGRKCLDNSYIQRPAFN